MEHFWVKPSISRYASSQSLYLLRLVAYDEEVLGEWVGAGHGASGQRNLIPELLCRGVTQQPGTIASDC